MTFSRRKLFATTLLLVASSAAAFANDDSTFDRKVYKTLIDPTRFDETTVQAKDALDDLQFWIELLTNALGFRTYGTFRLASGMPQTVNFYDTNDCKLHQKGYSFRTSRKVGEIDNGEGYLEFRSPARSVVERRDEYMHSCGTENLGDEHQIEVALDGDILYGFSQTCSLWNATVFSTMHDIQDTWASLREFERSSEESINVVDSYVIERVYEGFVVNFHGFNGINRGKFFVTLWYASPNATCPDLAEVSFKMIAKKGIWSEKTQSNVDTFWANFENAMRPWMSRPDASIADKIDWVYRNATCSTLDFEDTLTLDETYR